MSGGIATLGLATSLGLWTAVVRLERAPFDLLVVRRFQGIELLSQLTCSGMIVILSDKYTD